MAELAPSKQPPPVVPSFLPTPRKKKLPEKSFAAPRNSTAPSPRAPHFQKNSFIHKPPVLSSSKPSCAPSVCAQASEQDVLLEISISYKPPQPPPSSSALTSHSAPPSLSHPLPSASRQPTSASSNKIALRTLEYLEGRFRVQLLPEHANYVKAFFLADLNVPERRDFGYSWRSYADPPFALFHYFEQKFNLKRLCPVATLSRTAGIGKYSNLPPTCSSVCSPFACKRRRATLRSRRGHRHFDMLWS